MIRSTKAHDAKILEAVVALAKQKQAEGLGLSRGDIRKCVSDRAHAMGVDASYILEALEQKFDKQKQRSK